MRKLILLFLLSGCSLSNDDSGVKSKGIVSSIFESKGANNITSVKLSIQDTSGKVFFISKKLCADCLVGDSVKIIYHDNSLIEDAGDKYDVDSCIKFVNNTWKVERYTKTLYFYDDSGRLYKKIDTTFVNK